MSVPFFLPLNGIHIACAPYALVSYVQLCICCFLSLELCESKFILSILVIVCKVQALAQYWRNISTRLEHLLACRRKDACKGGSKMDYFISLLKPVRQRKLEFGCQFIVKNECWPKLSTTSVNTCRGNTLLWPVSEAFVSSYPSGNRRWSSDRS